MLEWVNKYTLELAIDQEKIKRWEDIELYWDTFSGYQYWTQTFSNREQAYYWIKQQKISKDKIFKQITQERKSYLDNWQRSPLEDLFLVFEKYSEEFKRQRELTKENLGWLANNYAQNNPVVYHREDAWLFWYFQPETQKYKPTERILPLTDILNDDKVERFSIEDLWKFIKLSIKQLSWEDITLEQAKDIASRIVIITYKDEEWKVKMLWNGFIFNWSIWTNQHITEWREWKLEVVDLRGNKFSDLQIHQIRNPKTRKDEVATKWKRDIAYISSSDLGKKDIKADFSLPLNWSYIIWVKSIETEISLWSKNDEPIALYINKVTLADNPNDSWEWVIYTSWDTTIPWTSWSMIINNWKIIWVNSYWKEDSFYIPFINIFLSSKKAEISWWGELFEWKSLKVS